jgi:hypothetical protein
VSDPTQASEPHEIPTFAECVVGYRAWAFDEEGQLWPLFSGRWPWQPGINTARCNCRTRTQTTLRFEWYWHEGRRVLEPAPPHAAPDPGCVCGLYSWRRPSKQWYEQPLGPATSQVIGAVASWGHLQVHNAGFRAEHACVVTLAVHPEAKSDEIETVKQIAARYRVDLVPISELEEAASEHGTPLPDTLRPPVKASMPIEDPAPHPNPAHAPNATIDEVGAAPPKTGFDGRPLPPGTPSFHR